jgi:hypothetical protein
MLSKKQFDDLWGASIGSLRPTILTPDYNDYLLREGMLEDYLDIFRGYSTRERNGEIRMPYPHPFFNADGTPKLDKTPCIEYILVGEAPRRLIDPTIYNSCSPIPGDIENTFFYDIRHIKGTSWLDAPRNAFGARPYTPCPQNKIECLLDLASKGVLLLDLFPFAISFTTGIRSSLNTAGITLDFWNNPLNMYNLQDRINRLSTLLCKEWDLSFVAPYKISEFIVNPANGFPPLAIVPPGLHPANFRLLLPNPTRCGGSPFKKVCISTAGFPSANLINLSF